jgi:branched-chain amino acid transport system substrate-binding protein
MVRGVGAAVCLLVIGVLAAGNAVAQESVKVGLIMPLTGQLGAVGKQLVAGVRLYVEQHGTAVAGRNLELVVKDDAGSAENSKRIAQELLVNDKASFIGAGLTPSALSIAPVATQAKVPEVVMISGTSIVTERSPYIVRTSFTLAQSSVILADWAAKNGSRKVVSLVSDWAPGIDAENSFKDRFVRVGGEIIESIRVPLANPDFAPFLQRARDAGPDTLFVFVPAGQAGTFAKQYIERGLHTAGIKLIGPGDLTDDDALGGMDDGMIGTVTALN